MSLTDTRLHPWPLLALKNTNPSLLLFVAVFSFAHFPVLIVHIFLVGLTEVFNASHPIHHCQITTFRNRRDNKTFI